MKSKFNIGDVIQIDNKKVMDYYHRLPDWCDSEHYTIVKFTGEYDPDGFQVVELDRCLGKEYTDTITIDFIKPCIKEQRKRKLQKIYARKM